MEPSRRTIKALHQLRQAELTLERARTELHDAVVADMHAGVTQAQLVRATGYSREWLRQLRSSTRSASASASAF